MNRKIIRSPLLFFILYGTMFIFGYIENFKGVTYPLIKAEFAVSYETHGVMVSALSLGYMLFCLAGGIIIGRRGVKRAFTAGFLLMMAGLAGAFFMPRFILTAGTLFLVFAGFGLFEVSINALATQVFTSRAALLMSLLHFFYGVGSSLSPRTAGILAASRGWRAVYLFAIPLVFVFFVLTIFTRFPRQQGTEQGETAAENSAGKNAGGTENIGADKNERAEKNAAGDRTLSAGEISAENFPSAKKTGFFTALKTPMVWVFSVVLGLMIVAEMGTVNWAAMYFQDVYNLDPKTSGAAFVSNFFIFLTISRLLSGFIIEKAGYMRSLFVAVLMVVVIFALGFILGPTGIHVLPFLGFFIAIFWPTTLAVAMGYFRDDAPVMTSAIIVIAGALNSGVQLLIGFTNRFAGPAWGYRSCLFYALLTIAAMIVLIRCMRRPYKAANTHA